jgi:hypothetical protein
MSEFRIDQIKSQDATRGPDVAGITTFTGTSGIVMPSGNTAYRGGRGRGIFGLQYLHPANLNVINYATIATTGNAEDFGDLSVARRQAQASSSSTRGVWGGGYPTQSTIDYIEIASTGNAMDFGDKIESDYAGNGVVSDGIRGFFMGGQANSKPGKIVQYITFANKGNATSFAELSNAHISGSSCSSPTRGLIGGGSNPAVQNTISYITLGTSGTSSDFGDLTAIKSSASSTSSSTRGLFISGQNPSFTNAIDYVTIASTGNAVDFGDTTHSGTRASGSTSNSIRGVFAGGYTPTGLNSIDRVTIATTGNAADFGDLTQDAWVVRACSDSHGGIG